MYTALPLLLSHSDSYKCVLAGLIGAVCSLERPPGVFRCVNCSVTLSALSAVFLVELENGDQTVRF